MARGIERLGLSIDAPMLDALAAHVRLLLAWTAAINLTAVRDPVAVAREHVLDSLSGVALLRDRGIDEILDLGSGGGYPGIPLAICLPARRALLVDSIGKKARFLATVADALVSEGRLARPSIEVASARAEQLAADPAQRERWGGVVVRAVASLPELAELALPLLTPGGSLVAWKRRPIDDEIAATEPSLAALGGGRIEIVPVRVAALEDHVLVAIEKRGTTPARFPRSPAERRRDSAKRRA